MKEMCVERRWGPSRKLLISVGPTSAVFFLSNRSVALYNIADTSRKRINRTNGVRKTH